LGISEKMINAHTGNYQEMVRELQKQGREDTLS
jgi:hypothetical protein